MVVEKAYGKINVYLDVIGKREDGYHDLEMVMINIGLYDEIKIKKSDKKEQITLTSNIELGPIEDNLVYKAGKIILDKYKIKSSVCIELNKKIFIAAGLAGGSSDAASTIKGLISLFNIKTNEEEILKICKSIGADVPYCYLGGTKLVKGIGDIISPLPPFPKTHVLLIKPDIKVLTKDIFGGLKKGDLHKKDSGKLTNLINGIRTSNIALIEDNFHNSLECVTIGLYDEIENIKKDLWHNFNKKALMSGSGPTVFAFFQEEEVGGVALDFFREKYPHIKDITLTSIIN